MKRAVILHGTDGTPTSNWLPWLKAELEKRGHEVWTPQLPDADAPNAQKYTKFLLGSGWDFQDNLMIGHSSGGVEILHLLRHLPQNVRLKTAVLAGAFSQVLADEPDWAQLKGLFEEPFDFAKITSKADKFLFVHGDNDPWCNPNQAELLAQKVGAEFVLVPGGQHFSTALDPAYTKFPELVELLDKRHLL